MFNLLLALITGLVIGWNFHAFFLQLTPPNILKNGINITQLSNDNNERIAPVDIVQKEPKQAPKEVKKIQKIVQNNQPIIKKETPIEINKEKNISIKAIPKINNFYEYLHNDLFSDAMNLYLDATEARLLLYQPTLLEYFETKIEKNPQKALDQMLEFQELEANERKVNIEILHEIEDNNYDEKAKILLNLIKEKMNKSEEYAHQLPLKKLGEHFTIEVSVNNESLTLLLDTGATLTMVNEDKLSSSLKVIDENILLNTAGGKINAKLQEADSFSVGDIELKKFQVVSSIFEQKDADGLLGMNFFKEFKFKIDQEKAILFLSEK